MPTRLVRLALATALCVAMTSMPDSARAQEPPPDTNRAAVVKLNEEGASFYQAREYRKAAEKFLAAYGIDPDPNLLFNIARCYELQGDVDGAIEKYEAYLAKPGADAEGRVKANEHLSALKKMKSSGASSEQPPPSPSQPSPPAVEANSDASGAWRTLGWVSLGVGVVAGTAGALTYVWGTNDHSEITDAKNFNQPGKTVDITQARAEDLRDSGSTKKTVGGIAMGVGGAALVGAVVFFLLGSPRTERGVNVGIVQTNGGGMAVVSGAL